MKELLFIFFSIGGESGITLDLFWFLRELSCCSGKSSKTFLMVLREQELSSLKCCQEGSWRIITKHKHCHPALEFISQLLYFHLLCKKKNIKDFDIIDIMLLVLDQGEHFQLMNNHPHILRRIRSFFCWSKCGVKAPLWWWWSEGPRCWGTQRVSDGVHKWKITLKTHHRHCCINCISGGLIEGSYWRSWEITDTPVGEYYVIIQMRGKQANEWGWGGSVRLTQL